PSGGAHRCEGVVQVGPDLAARARGAEGVTGRAVGGEEGLAGLRAPTLGDAAGAAARSEKGDAGEGGERKPRQPEAPLAVPSPGRAGSPRVRLKRPVEPQRVRQRPPKPAAGSTTGSARGPRPASGRS